MTFDEFMTLQAEEMKLRAEWEKFYYSGELAFANLAKHNLSLVLDKIEQAICSDDPGVVAWREKGSPAPKVDLPSIADIKAANLAELRTELETKHDMTNHPKRDVLWQLASDYGQGNDYQIEAHYNNMVVLLK